MGLPLVALVVKNPPANAVRHKIFRFDPWVGKIPWRMAWATHSNILAWRITCMEEPGRIWSIMSQIVT